MCVGLGSGGVPQAQICLVSSSERNLPAENPNLTKHPSGILTMGADLFTSEKKDNTL